MKRCPHCQSTYTNDSLNFCFDDGARLVYFPASSQVDTLIIPDINQALQQSSEVVPNKTDNKTSNAGIEQDFRNKSASELLDRTSTTGMLAMYACILAHLKQIAFSLQELCSKLKIVHYDYAVGFLTAIISIDLLDINESKGIWNIIKVNEQLQNNLKAAIDERIKAVNELDYSDDVKESIRKTLQADIDTIEQYFR